MFWNKKWEYLSPYLPEEDKESFRKDGIVFQ